MDKNLESVRKSLPQSVKEYEQRKKDWIPSRVCFLIVKKSEKLIFWIKNLIKYLNIKIKRKINIRKLYVSPQFIFYLKMRLWIIK